MFLLIALLIFNEPTLIKDQSLVDVTINAPAQFQNAEITKLATVKGSLYAKESSLKNLYVIGNALVDQVRIKDLFIDGALFALNSEIEQMSILADELSLTNTQVKKMFVRKNGSSLRQLVYMEKGSSVDSIEFESKQGTVILTDGSVEAPEVQGGKCITIELQGASLRR